MKKTYIIIGVVVALVVATLIYFRFRTSSLDKTIDKVRAYDQYTLTCNMEMVENDELKTYLVNVSYLKNKKQEYYKVDLFDKSLNQSQVIIKNKEGVFVLTPTLNQIFKFQSKWPNNSPKPYIYSSLIDLLEKGDVEKTKSGYKVTKKIKYPNDSRIVKQEEVFDKNLSPKRVIAYDKDETEVIKVIFSSFKTNSKLTKDDFDEQKVIKETKQTTSSKEDLPLYPVALMGSTLDSETVSKNDDEVSHILKFTGDKNYTIVETSSISEEVSVQDIDEDMIDLVDGVGYYEDDKLTMINSGVICSIYSSELTKDEMVSIISSMQSSITK